jgi:hypothetical protein
LFRMKPHQPPWKECFQVTAKEWSLCIGVLINAIDYLYQLTFGNSHNISECIGYYGTDTKSSSSTVENGSYSALILVRLVDSTSVYVKSYSNCPTESQGRNWLIFGDRSRLGYNWTPSHHSAFSSSMDLLWNIGISYIDIVTGDSAYQKETSPKQLVFRQDVIGITRTIVPPSATISSIIGPTVFVEFIREAWNWSCYHYGCRNNNVYDSHGDSECLIVWIFIVFISIINNWIQFPYLWMLLKQQVIGLQLRPGDTLISITFDGLHHLLIMIMGYIVSKSEGYTALVSHLVQVPIYYSVKQELSVTSVSYVYLMNSPVSFSWWESVERLFYVLESKLSSIVRECNILNIDRNTSPTIIDARFLFAGMCCHNIARI